MGPLPRFGLFRTQEFGWASERERPRNLSFGSPNLALCRPVVEPSNIVSYSYSSRLRDRVTISGALSNSKHITYIFQPFSGSCQDPYHYSGVKNQAKFGNRRLLSDGYDITRCYG